MCAWQVTQPPSTARLEEAAGSSTGLCAAQPEQELGPGDWDDVLLPVGCQLCLQLPLSCPCPEDATWGGDRTCVSFRVQRIGEHQA